MPVVRALRAAVGALAMVACAEPPVQWEEPAPAPAGEGRLVVDAAGAVSRAPLRAPVAVPPAAIDSGCPGSVRHAWRDSALVHAAWWRPRSDSSAALVAATSHDGGRTWGATVPVDSTDVSVDGCRRPPPAIAATGDDVHVAYGLRGREGAGVFFAHSMERGALYHEPVPIVYGDRPGAAAIAAEGHRVVVAYEDPNTSPAAVGLAVSETQGHIFERRLPASAGTGAATAPEVALSGDVVAVAWQRTLLARGAGATPAGSVVRVGRLAPRR